MRCARWKTLASSLRGGGFGPSAHQRLLFATGGLSLRHAVRGMAMQSIHYTQSLSVGFEYDVWFARNVWDSRNPLLGQVLCRSDDPAPRSAMVFVDAGVAEAHPNLADHIESYFHRYRNELKLATPPQVVPGGETAKNELQHARKAISLFEEAELCRHAFIIVIGGGAVLDAVGFAAALYHRGLRLVRMPTTVLAQNDVGVGVKNAVNYPAGKNTLGTFWPPWAVINDFSFLTTLPSAHWIGGVAEAFKVAMIRDADFFEFLCKVASRLRQREIEPMERLIIRCAELHLEHIRTGGDPFELGRARPLDFGHWAAHALEVMSNYTVSHGEAVAIGLALDSRYAVQKDWLAERDFCALYRGLKDCGFRLWHPNLRVRDEQGRLALLGGLDAFRRHLGGRLYLTFPRGIGRRFEVSEMDLALIEKCIGDLRELDERPC